MTLKGRICLSLLDIKVCEPLPPVALAPFCTCNAAITIAMAVAKMKNAGCLNTKSMFEFIYYDGNLKV